MKIHKNSVLESFTETTVVFCTFPLDVVIIASLDGTDVMLDGFGVLVFGIDVVVLILDGSGVDVVLLIILDDVVVVLILDDAVELLDGAVELLDGSDVDVVLLIILDDVVVLILGCAGVDVVLLTLGDVVVGSSVDVVNVVIVVVFSTNSATVLTTTGSPSKSTAMLDHTFTIASNPGLGPRVTAVIGTSTSKPPKKEPNCGDLCC